MSAKISSLSAAEDAYVKQQLGEAPAFIRRFSPGDADRPVTLDIMDQSARSVVLLAAMRGKAPRLGRRSVALLQPPAEVPPVLLARIIDQRDNGIRGLSSLCEPWRRAAR